MKMNPANVRKHRKVLVSQRRTSSLSRNRSITPSCKNSGNNKHKVTALLKNNKNLALALQDAQCKLSVKQKLLENAAKHLNNILQARVLMLEMHSDLESVVKKFDNVLLLLDVDEIKISDLISPFQSCSQFKNKIKQLAESVKKVSEENSFSIVAENADHDINVIKPPNHQIISSDYNSAAEEQAMEINTIDVIRKEVENESTFNSKKTTDAVNLKQPVEICENVEAKIDSPVRKGSPEKNDALKDGKDSGTPRLSIPNIKLVNNTELISHLKQCLTSKIYSPLKSVAKVSNTSISSSSVKSSKIPTLHVLTVAKKNESNETSTQPKICSQKNVSGDSDLKTVSRKTFFVKNSNISTSSSQSNDTLNKNDIQNESDFVIEESAQTSSRKTFVIKKLDIPDERKSIANRRKTFVKKSANTNVRKSLKNRRGTFVISGNIEECTSNENVNSASERTFNDDTIKQKNLGSEIKIVEELPLVCDKTNGITEEEFQENLSKKDISSTKQSEKIISEDKHTIDTNNVHKQEEFKLENNKENSYEVEVGHKKLPTSKIIESSDVMMFEECGQPVISDEDQTKVKDNTHSSKLKAALHKSSLELSDSGCSTIPDLDLLLLDLPLERKLLKPVPIRKRVSGSKKKKVFVFNTHKRKSVQHKKSLGIVQRTSAKLFNVTEECNDVSQSTSSTNIKNVEVASKLSEFEVKENLKKHISYNFASNIPDNDGNNCNTESPCSSNQEVIKCSATGGEDAEMFKSVSSKNVDKITASESCKKIKRDSLLCLSSPVIAFHKLNTIECDNGDLDSEKEQDNICKSETRYKKGNSKLDKKSKIKKCIAKSVVDDIYVVKVNRKQNSMKQAEQMVTSKVEQENKMCVLNANKRKSVRHKKSLGIVQKTSKLFNVTEECNDVSQSTSSTNIKNVKVASKLSECEDKENFKEHISCNFAFNIPDNEGNSNNIQSPCSSNQETVSESCKNIKKDSLLCLPPSVITSHKFINAIECDNRDLNSGKEQDTIICKSKTRYKKENSRSDKKSKITKSVAKNGDVDDYDISDKKVNRKQNSKKQSKQMLTSKVEEKNKNDIELKNESQEKRTKKKYQTRRIKHKKDSLSNVPTDNIFIVEAEVHSPPDSCDKENKEICKSENCVVVLNDMFQSASIDQLSLLQEIKTAPKDKIVSSTIPLSDNSSNILISKVNHNIERKGDITKSVIDTERPKRRKNVNYKEPTLNKKMRRGV